MSHFTVLVIGDNPEKQLQPFHEYECTGIEDEYVKFIPVKESIDELQNKYEEYKEDYDSFENFMHEYYGYDQQDGVWGRKTNPDYKWDWYELGGRWTGFFKLKPNKSGEQGLPGLGAIPAKDGYVDQALKGDIDFDSIKKESAQDAEDYWNKIEKAFSGEIPKLDLTWDFISNNEKYSDLNIQQKRDLYNSQPAMVKLIELYKNNKDFVWTNLEDFQCSKEDYIQKNSSKSFITFAVVKDSKWYEKGSMGWWGFVSDEKEDRHWETDFLNLLNEISDDTLLSVFDCHI